MPVIDIKVPPGFDLSTVVFSYGWALLCPNAWKQACLSQMATSGICNMVRHRNQRASCCSQASSGESEPALPVFARPLYRPSGEIVNAKIRQPSKQKINVELEPDLLSVVDCNDLENQASAHCPDPFC